MSTSAENSRRPPPPPPPPRRRDGRGGDFGERLPWRVEGQRSGPPDTPPGGRPTRPQPSFWALLAVLFLVNWLLSSWFLAPAARTDISYTFFRDQVEAGKVAEITSTDDAIQGRFTEEVRYPPGEKGEPVTRFTTHRPSFAEDDLFQLLEQKEVEVSARPLPGPSLMERLLLGFGPTLLLVGLFLLIARRAGGATGAITGLGKSRAQRYRPERGRRVCFDDVAGIDDVEEEVAEIVDFLRNPDRYRRLGAKAPKGVLLSGPPGTGKTLLARALAGEANVPFYSVSASEFIEMIVGVGASRVRDLFEQAKKDAPAIIFIDELDSIGRARGGATSVGGHDEREQTLNQILTEMDGFDGTEGVVVLGATNRPEILDPALLRPGRFDRRLTISPPDRAGRRAILDVHVRDVPLADDVDLDAVAASTPGMVGAELQNLINEAAILAARRSRDRVQTTDFNDALEKIVLGTARRIVLSPEERRRTAYHEAGHALLGMLTPGADPVRKISIVPRGHALGVTFQSPDDDRYGYPAAYLLGRIAGALGGRAAEELVFGEVTTGAENDLEQATRLARQMVGRWGMSPALGPVSLLPGPGHQPTFGFDGDEPAPTTLELLDAEVRRLLEEGAERAQRTLAEHRSQLDSLVEALVAAETLDAEDAYRAAGMPLPKNPPERVADRAVRPVVGANGGVAASDSPRPS
ncbi:MAG TPA: ATP-dependent zinc metalloprotease FtsH [Acidimicrobiales bacterium]|nr:ATP-dependent zinc metalloprotease FtsH [Acidimicrobiales bacterium]